MSPSLKTSDGGRIGADVDEQWGVETGGRDGSGGEGRIDPGRCGRDSWPKLPTDEADLAPLSRRRSDRAAASECGTGIESRQAKELPATSSEVSAEEVFRRGRRAVWADLGSRTSGE